MLKLWMLFPLLAVIVLQSNALSMAATPSFEEFDRKARNGEPLSVVFFGGSLTWGANASDPQTTSYRGLMTKHLQTKYPKAPFTFHDAAIGGTGSKLGLFRLQRDVLAFKPNLVFLDFTANDDLYGSDLPTLASYECLLREMIGQNIPVMQVFLGFKFNFGADWKPEGLPRVLAHQKLAAAYHTATGDCFPLVNQRLESGQVKLDQLWPFDGAHPDDVGYQLFFEAVRDGFEQAVAQKRVCIVPEKPVFSDQYKNRQRIRLADSPLPAGWEVAKTYRTSMWYDGLSSRWMGDVAMCDLNNKATAQPLTVEFSGTFLGLFGEADENGLSFKATVDGKPVLYQPNPKATPTDVWPWTVKHMGTGRLFIWRELTGDLAPGKHTLVLQPIFPDGQAKGQLRIESICVASD